jgi:hypothetical protein
MLKQNQGNMFAAKGIGSTWLIYILLKAFFNKQLRRTKIVRGSSSTTQMQLYSYTLPEHIMKLNTVPELLLGAINLAPSNYLLRFNVGVSMQKFSASTLQKIKKLLTRFVQQ